MFKNQQEKYGWKIPLLIGILLACFFFQGFDFIRKHSATVDEVLYIPAGYSFWKTGTLRANPETQSLPRIISAIPLRFLPVKFDPKTDRPQFKDRYHWASYFLFTKNREIAQRMIFWARLPNLLLGAFLILGIFLCARDIFGSFPAFLALTFACFHPSLVAHSSLATADLPLTAFFFWTTYAFWKIQESHHWKFWMLGSGIFLGFALLCKSSAWLLLPLLVILGLSHKKSRGVTAILIVFSLAWILMNSLFLFQGTFSQKTLLLQQMPGEWKESFLLRWITYFLPDACAGPLLFNLAQSFGALHPFPIFLNGHYSQTGFPHYFVTALVLKTPLALLIMFFIGILATKNFPLSKKLFLFLPWSFFLFYFSFLNKLALGVRYVLPVIPFLLILSAGTWIVLAGHWRWLLLFLVAWNVISVLRIHPHHLAYFNELAGGPSRGHEHMVDSDLDWGQDLTALKNYMDQKGIKEIRLSYFGMADPLYYGIRYRYLPSPKFQPWTQRHRHQEQFRVEPGFYAISATNLRGTVLENRDLYSWFRTKQPIGSAGYSILIYFLDS